MAKTQAQYRPGQDDLSRRWYPIRVAWVTPYPPDRNGGGGHIRQAHLLLALAQHASVTLITGGQVTDVAVRDATEQIVEVGGEGRNWLQRGRAARRAGDLWGVTVNRQAREARALGRLRAVMIAPLAQVEADLVLIEFTGLAPLIDEAALAGLRSRARWILTLHNVTSRMAAHQAAIMTERRQRWLFQREAVLAQRLETRALQRFDDIIVVSDEDRDALGPSDRLHVVGNGVDLDRFSPSPVPVEPRVVFTGALYTSPNTDAAQWFCTEIFPRIRAAVPAATIDLVGADPPDAVRSLAARPGVQVHADVGDVRPFIERARVAVVPVRIGSGTRLKVLEAWAMGRPVVGTSVGLEGLGCAEGIEALVADESASFAAAVVHLLQDGPEAETLARCGRAFAVKHHGWDAVHRRFAAVIWPPLAGS